MGGPPVLPQAALAWASILDWECADLRLWPGAIPSPPPANASGNRYYALAERSTGRIEVFAGWSRFKAELPDGTTPSSLPQGSFIGTHELEEAFAFIGRRHPEQSQAKLYF